MNTKRITILILAVAVTGIVGCKRAESETSELIERAKRSEPVLTSTSAREAPIPLEREQEVPPSAPEETQSAVEPRSEPRPFEPITESQDGLAIQRLLTAPAIENREPAGATGLFGHHDERVYAFVELSNESETDETLLVHFIGPDGQVSGGIELRVPAQTPRWRTWAYTRNAKEPGLWRVEIRNEDGSLLGALPFEVEPGC